MSTKTPIITSASLILEVKYNPTQKDKQILQWISSDKIQCLSANHSLGVFNKGDLESR